jgi:two-component system, LytTR family, sensor kinase
VKKIKFKKGFLISLVISGLTTTARIARINATQLGYLIFHFVYLFSLIFIIWFVCQYFVHQKKKKTAKIVLYLILTGVISIVHHVIIQYLFAHWFMSYSDFPLIDKLSDQQQYLTLQFRGIVYGALVYFILYYFNIIVEKQNSILEIQQLKKEKLEAQLNSLKQQISPHFLFNSLSTLKTMVKEADAKKFIIQLSNVYRYLLQFNEHSLTTLREELDFTNSYLHVLRERFEEALEVTMQIDETVLDKRLPPLALQLLIENAIKHNIISLDEHLLIEIFNEKDVFLVVRNTLHPKLSREKSTGVGLQNIKERYALLSDKKIEIHQSDLSFAVKIPLL